MWSVHPVPGQERQCSQETYWLLFQQWSVMIPAGIPCLCVLSGVLVKMFLYDLYNLGDVSVSVYVQPDVVTDFQSSQPMLIPWCSFPVVSDIVLPSFGDPCPYQASLHSGLCSAVYYTQALSSWSRQGCGTPSHVPLQLWRQTVPGWISKSLSQISNDVILLFGHFLGHTWTIMSCWSFSSLRETIKIKVDLLNGQLETWRVGGFDIWRKYE